MKASTTIIFTRHADGSISADGFPDEILVSSELLDLAARGEAMPELRLDGPRLLISVRNGAAIYIRGPADAPGKDVRFMLQHGPSRV